MLSQGSINSSRRLTCLIFTVYVERVWLVRTGCIRHLMIVAMTDDGSDSPAFINSHLLLTHKYERHGLCITAKDRIHAADGLSKVLPTHISRR